MKKKLRKTFNILVGLLICINIVLPSFAVSSQEVQDSPLENVLMRAREEGFCYIFSDDE